MASNLTQQQLANQYQGVASGTLTSYPYPQSTLIAVATGSGTGFWTTAGGGSPGGAVYQYPAAVMGPAMTLQPYTPTPIPYVMIDTRIEFSEEEIMRAEQIMEECDAARTP